MVLADLAALIHHGGERRVEDMAQAAQFRIFSRRESVRICRQLVALLLEQIEIDRLADELRSAKFVGASPPLVVAIGGHHHDREAREPLFDLAQQLQAVHPRHIDVRENRDQRGVDLASEPIQRLSARGGEMMM
jgi:hypothetical protein